LVPDGAQGVVVLDEGLVDLGEFLEDCPRWSAALRAYCMKARDNVMLMGWPPGC